MNAQDAWNMCILSLEVDEQNSSVRAKIYILDGAIRKKIINALAIHCGIGTAIITDTIGRTHLRRLDCFNERQHLLPQLLYTRWMLNHCSLRIKRNQFGLHRGKKCDVCGDMSSWGIDNQGNITCITCYYSL